MRLAHCWISIVLYLALNGCKPEDASTTLVETAGSDNGEKSNSMLPDPSLTSIEIVEAALQAWKNDDREQFDTYLDGLGDPKDEIWSSLTENCNDLDVEILHYEELESPPGDMGEDSPNVVYVRVSANADVLGGFIMHRWPRKHWEISRGGLNCG